MKQIDTLSFIGFFQDFLQIKYYTSYCVLHTDKKNMTLTTTQL